MRQYTTLACESIDASIFSGDEFFNKASLDELELYLQRWQRVVIERQKEIEETK